MEPHYCPNKPIEGLTQCSSIAQTVAKGGAAKFITFDDRTLWVWIWPESDHAIPEQPLPGVHAHTCQQRMNVLFALCPCLFLS